MKWHIPLLCVVLLVLMGCSDFIIPYAEYTYESYDGSLAFDCLTESAQWSPRWDHASAVFDGYLWVFGGYDTTARGEEDSYREDIWRSSDGVSWELLEDDAPWKGRRGHAVALMGDTLYLSGGFTVDQDTGIRSYANDVWKSSDGVSWECVTADAPWGVRMNHGMVAANDGTDDRLYLFGGFYDGMYYRSDMWESLDGETWEEVPLPEGAYGAFPGARAAFAYCTGDNGKIYMQGGSFYGAASSSTGHVDTAAVPYLPNTMNWSSFWWFDPEAPASGWQYDKWGVLPTGEGNTRSEQVVIPFRGDLWMFAGKSNSGWQFSQSEKSYLTMNYHYEDISYDKPVIETDSLGSPFDPRYGYTAEILDGDLYILGGFSNDGPLHDVWRCEGEE